MRRFRPGRVVLLLAAVAAVAAVGIRLSLPDRTTPPASLRAAQATLLDRRAAVVRIDPMPLGKILKRLGTLYGTRIDTDWEAMGQVGLSLRPEWNVLVELRLHDVTLRQALAKVVDSLPDGDALVVEPAHGAVLIRTLPAGGPFPQPASDPVARLYDVRDLLAVMESEQNRGARFDNPGIICFPGASPPPPPVTAVQQELEAMLTDGVRPERWTVNGGSGVFLVAGGRIVVVDTPDVQQEVETFLNGLRDSLRAPYSKGGDLAAPLP